PLRIVAPYTVIGGGTNRSASGMVVRKDLVDAGRWTEPRDFRGMTIAWSVQGGSPQMYVERALALGGLTVDDVTRAQLSFPDMLAAVLNGNIDAGWQIEPFISIGSQRQASVLAVKGGDLSSGLIPVTLVMGLPFAAQQPESARRFVTAWLKGARGQWQAFRQNGPNQEEVIEILTRHTAIKDPNVYRALAATGETLGTGPIQNADLPASGLEPYQDYYLKAGTVSQRVAIADIIDTSYAQAAVQR